MGQLSQRTCWFVEQKPSLSHELMLLSALKSGQIQKENFLQKPSPSRHHLGQLSLPKEMLISLSSNSQSRCCLVGLWKPVSGDLFDGAELGK